MLQQRWKEYRDRKVDDVLRRMPLGTNFTSIHDVPLTVRMEEIIDKSF